VKVDGKAKFLSAVDPAPFDQILDLDFKTGELNRPHRHLDRGRCEDRRGQGLAHRRHRDGDVRQDGEHAFRIAALYRRADAVGQYVIR